jgi:AraC-like DNA-binding protein
MTATVNAIVAHIVEDRSITRVTDLAERLGTSTRRLERLFAEHVGLGPKWVINRCRLHEAVEVATRSEAVDWATLAAQFGYSDQSHLVRDFTATIGSSPQRYAQLARRSPPEGGSPAE